MMRFKGKTWECSAISSRVSSVTDAAQLKIASDWLINLRRAPLSQLHTSARRSLTTKEAAPATQSRGLSVEGNGKSYRIASASPKMMKPKKGTHTHQEEREIGMPLSPANLRPRHWRLRSLRPRPPRIGPEEIRYRRDRHRNQDRQHHALQWTGLRLRRDRHTEAAYFKKINDEGGTNGRKINYISYDDATRRRRRWSRRASWSRATRLPFIFNSLGTLPNSAIHKYMNSKRCRSCSSRPAPPSGTIRSHFA